jgi:hypothetical protein
MQAGPNTGAWRYVASLTDVLDAQADEIAVAELAVDGEIEESEISETFLNLKPHSDRPDFLKLHST